ncbi:glycosyltransferase family 2 protein [Halopseudomonas xiamenensis]|uniref:glycosyltransferase family 2 protein n=1 Tax=Halopseudomonas xiamenensis TaxID=157792 RepID=UPI001C89F4EC|nr:glycosyltransferase family 2 protein [Halopseudomonas xiamenensis]
MGQESMVSVIMPNYNGGEYIGAAIQSVLSQTYADLELIVVDDGSTDKSLQEVERIKQQDSRVKLIRMPGNSGAAKSRNAAILESVGRFIAFLDCDDLWYEQKLEVQLAEMIAAGSAISCTAVDVIDSHGGKVGARKVPEVISYSTLLRKTPIVTSSVIFDTDQVGRVLMPDIIRRQDLAMWLKIIRMNGVACGIDKCLGAYRVHSYSLSRNKVVSAKYTWKVIREVENLSLIKSAYYFSFYAVGGLLGRLRGVN